MGIGINIIARKAGEEIEKFVKLIFEARKDDNRNALLYNSAGEDSVPLDDERLVLAKVDGAGKYAALAVLTQSQGAKPGEKIFFARDPDAEIVSKISMLNDGSVTIDTTGNYTRKNKGVVDITENDSRTYVNEKDVTSTIKGKLSETVEGNYSLEGKKNINVKSGASAVNEAAQSNKIKGGADVTLAAPGAAAWCPNAIPTCPFGIPHGGEAAGITGLKGE